MLSYNKELMKKILMMFAVLTFQAFTLAQGLVGDIDELEQKAEKLKDQAAEDKKELIGMVNALSQRVKTLEQERLPKLEKTISGFIPKPYNHMMVGYVSGDGKSAANPHYNVLKQGAGKYRINFKKPYKSQVRVFLQGVIHVHDYDNGGGIMNMSNGGFTVQFWDWSNDGNRAQDASFTFLVLGQL